MECLSYYTLYVSYVANTVERGKMDPCAIGILKDDHEHVLLQRNDIFLLNNTAFL